MTGPSRGRHIDLTSPRGYYLDYSARAEPRCPVDSSGAPGVSKGRGRVEPSPLLVARSALGNLELYLGGARPERRDRFESLSRWLVEHQEIIPGSYGGWSMPAVGRGSRARLEAGWFSGATHAECVSVLVRAALLLRLEGAAAAAQRAVAGFRTRVEDGGFLREMGDAGDVGGLESLTFIMERAGPNPGAMDLSVHVRGLWALFDFGFLSRDDSVDRLFDRCVDGLAFVLDRYDLGYWSLGCLDSDGRIGGPSSAETHEELTIMLETMYTMTGRDEFLAVAQRWRSCLDRIGCRTRALVARAVPGAFRRGPSWIP